MKFFNISSSLSEENYTSIWTEQRKTLISSWQGRRLEMHKQLLFGLRVFVLRRKTAEEGKNVIL